jgi:ABC-type nickel/cobalt efflux system permease component RcnA
MRRTHGYLGALLAVAVCCLAATDVRAHPVPADSHDRTIVVRLAREGDGNKLVVTVAYRLEVDELTVIGTDMQPFVDEVPFAKFGRNRLDAFYGEFTRIYAPLLARKLRADVDGAQLTFACVKREHTVRDENGQLLGHLRCDFQFQASAVVTPGGPHRFRFREGNYLLQKGLIDVSLTTAGGLRLLDKVVPSAELKKRAVNFLAPGDDDRLRQVSATFELVTPAATPGAEAAPAAQKGQPRHESSWLAELFHLILHSPDVVLILLFAALIGAVHALTPGHGKTMIAAYLIGKRGTVWHALGLGLVTTFTHTATMIIAALVLWLTYGSSIPTSNPQVETGLELAMGLLVACVGIWLLLRRLSGKADHFHIGGGHDHHHYPHDHAHHTHADHDHDADGRVIPRDERVRWRGLLGMGVSGGIIPCWDGIALLALTVNAKRIWLALPLALAFSLGLACVLVLLGILVVRARGFATSRWGEGRFVRSLPIISAVAVTVLGFWLCYAAVHSPPPQGQAAARAVESRP